MESVRKLEVTVAQWYKNVPHLPKNVQKWLADNVWWLAIIGAVLGAFAVLAIISGTLLVGAMFATAGAVGVALGGLALVAVLVSLATVILTTVLTALAVSPLKVHKKKGWELLFLAELVSLASAVLGGVLSFNVSGILSAVVGVAIGAYFLFEIRGYFGTVATTTARKPVVKVAEK